MVSLSDLGELRVIHIMERALGTSRRTVVSFGDDISAVRVPGGKIAVLKTDMLVGSTDLPPGMTLRQAAWKAVVANVSDLAAKGVRPLAGLVALGLPRSLKRSDIEQLARGLSEAAKAYKFPIVGGDTNESCDLTISIALFAITNAKKLILRTGARDGDLVAVTGEFGSSSAALRAVLEHEERPGKLQRGLYKALYSPRAQLDLGLRLAASGTVTSSIDSSDGLAWSLHQLSESSQLGIVVENVPVSNAAIDFARRYRVRALDLALYGGEEYELIVTVNPRKFQKAFRAANGRLKQIGYVTRGFRGVRIKRGRSMIPVKKKGWEHFKN
ncbi:MAG TPA: thiamine-phosphate kinase [Candidatus Bathyarchaeia archaeon]|nr:thiamine-phosphate kinase [Candidatus Bathyarchaeia archaeon]